MFISYNFQCIFLITFRVHFPQLSMNISHYFKCIFLTIFNVYFSQFAMYISHNFQCLFYTTFNVYFTQLSTYTSHNYQCIFLTNFNVYFTQLSVYISHSDQCRLLCGWFSSRSITDITALGTSQPALIHSKDGDVDRCCCTQIGYILDLRVYLTQLSMYISHNYQCIFHTKVSVYFTHSLTHPVTSI